MVVAVATLVGTPTGGALLKEVDKSIFQLSRDCLVLCARSEWMNLRRLRLHAKLRRPCAVPQRHILPDTSQIHLNGALSHDRRALR